MKRPIKFLASILMLTGCLDIFDISAQVSVSYAMDSPTFTLAHEDTDKYETLDTCYLNVSYLLKYRNSEKDDSLSFNDIMDLQMGRHYNAFFSRDLRALDTRNTKELKTNMQFSTIPENYIGFDVLINHSDSLTTVTNRLPYTSQVIEYSESTDIPKWTYMPEDVDTIMGYHCHVAICNYEGRDWKVYYTNDIPIPYGPWKLNGVKGLVLKAVDTENNFIFEAVGLTQKPQSIIRYDWSRKKMKKEDWKKFERDMYKNAGSFVRNTGARILIMDNSEQGFHRLNEDWSQYYNPIGRK
ncbi:GLPGLI family protein [Lepagella muris]|jgi:GLPGLI family protein|uniref:GLPGLI family protein n=1 Tax=Lepagella muris TaxID=3032870 RepID=A0AC61RGS2_9BACT|nr:GLPGLI family protein [Lepagella muris]ROT08121.1 GLPGLI family protein [Muribaculaceae bacterium Isolate-037 (Harlan)]TGY78731.1 GLPGLI family protein [Lepagella muris]THG52186.1 GLPGLI family protein [Bacteroidales bacterium]TKC55239.1 GLPGLI family protein [Bacteroidales bacterium]